MRKTPNSICVDNRLNMCFVTSDYDKDSCRGECIGDDNSVSLGGNNFSLHLCSHCDDGVAMHDLSFQFPKTTTLPQYTMAPKEQYASVRLVEAPYKSIDDCSVSSRPQYCTCR